jgi:hypothetical protein
VHARYVAKGCLVIGVDLVHFETVLKQFSVHYLLNLTGIN